MFDPHTHQQYLGVGSSALNPFIGAAEMAQAVTALTAKTTSLSDLHMPTQGGGGRVAGTNYSQ